MAGFTLGITTENVPAFSSCSSVIGLDAPGEIYTSGRKMEGVWFENREAAAAHQAQMPRVPPGRYHGLVVSPLRTARLDPPDVCLFYGNPAQMILFINGLQWRNYRRYDFSITGESACADSWGHALKTRTVSLSIPCYAERRYGAVTDDEMLMACPPEDLQRAVTGLQGLSKAGLRYPIMPFGPQAEPAEGMAQELRREELIAHRSQVVPSDGPAASLPLRQNPLIQHRQRDRDADAWQRHLCLRPGDRLEHPASVPPPVSVRQHPVLGISTISSTPSTACRSARFWSHCRLCCSSDGEITSNMTRGYFPQRIMASGMRAVSRRS